MSSPDSCGNSSVTNAASQIKLMTDNFLYIAFHMHYFMWGTLTVVSFLGEDEDERENGSQQLFG